MIPILILGAVLHTGLSWSGGNGSTATASATVRDASPSSRLEKLDESKLRKLIHSRKGKALFINVWATWCQPCVEEFPDIVKLSEDMKGQKIEFVGVSGDDSDDESSKVIPFIKKEKAHFKFYIAKLEGEDEFINTFDKEWGGGIPATFTYDTKGQLRAFLIGKQSYQKLKAAVEKALKN